MKHTQAKDNQQKLNKKQEVPSYAPPKESRRRIAIRIDDVLPDGTRMGIEKAILPEELDLAIDASQVLKRVLDSCVEEINSSGKESREAMQ